MPRRILSSLVVALVVSVAGACSPSSSATPSLFTAPATATVAPTETEPAASPAASDETFEPDSSAMTQTDTAWGRIWDAIPRSFPVYPGAESTTDIGAPASAQFAISADVNTVTAWTKTALDATGLRTTVSGPLEDGSMTLDSVGASGCVAQTSIGRLGGVTLVTILYGAKCPWS